MNVYDYLKSVEDRVGYIVFSGEHEELHRLVRFWKEFDPDDRPFLHSRSLTLKEEEEEPVTVPVIVLRPAHLFHLAMKNGARGKLGMDYSL